jgi:predicted HTH domain antitoxin
MSVRVEFPEELLVAAREEPAAFTRNVMLDTLGRLYVQGKISAGIGAQLLGCSRSEFYQLLSARGFAIIDYAADEWKEEVRTSRILADQVKPGR